jgi:HSP20 family protein
MRQQLDQLFEDASGTYQRVGAGVFPLINLTEDKDNYYVRAELPGVKGEELDIQVTGNNLAITGERKIAAEEEGAKYHRREREAGSFSRMIGLPGDIDPDKVDAKLENGILTVEVSKAEAAKPKQITVKS